MSLQLERINEVWKDIKSFPKYQISNKGRIRSQRGLDYYILKPIKDLKGYLYVHLRINSISYTKKLHHLVLEAFVGPRPNGCETNHKDGIKGNNYFTNLEWVTPSKNMQHALKIGLRKFSWPLLVGEKHSQAKLKDGEVWLIKKLLWFEHPQNKTAKMFKVCPGTIQAIKNGRTWFHIKFEPTETDRIYYRKHTK